MVKKRRSNDAFWGFLAAILQEIAHAFGSQAIG